MDSLTRPIERVVEATHWFVATPSLRVLHITTTGLLRVPVLRHVTATELLEQNDAPFFVLEAPVEPDDDGWALRCEELRRDWEGLVKSAPKEFVVVPLWPECVAQTPLARFAMELSQALHALRPPMGGLVIVLTPVWVRYARRWCDDLQGLLHEPGLRKARFVVVEAEEATSLPVVEALGAAAEKVDACIDDRDLREEMNARLDAMRNAPPSATGPQLVGAAGPPVSPPERKNRARPIPPEERAARAREIGVPEVLFDLDAMQQLRVLILSAALTMRDGRVAEGVELQRQARDFCVRHDLMKEAVVSELVLAGYVMQSGHHARAVEVFRDGRARAERCGFADLTVQAQIAIGSCLLLLERVEEAAAAYAEGGRLGVNAGSTVLAIEAFRMCGQLLASRGQFGQAAAAFREALLAADDRGATIKAASSAPEAARALAELCRQHGFMVQAASLEAQAATIETSMVQAAVQSETAEASPGAAV